MFLKLCSYNLGFIAPMSFRNSFCVTGILWETSGHCDASKDHVLNLR